MGYSHVPNAAEIRRPIHRPALSLRRNLEAIQIVQRHRSEARVCGAKLFTRLFARLRESCSDSSGCGHVPVSALRARPDSKNISTSPADPGAHPEIGGMAVSEAGDFAPAFFDRLFRGRPKTAVYV